MARGRSFRGERDTTDVASPELDRLLAPVTPSPPVRPAMAMRAYWREVEDLRQFDPTRSVVTPMKGTAVPARIVMAPVIGSDSGSRKVQTVVRPERFRFSEPEKVMVCVRRKTRREVLFAKDLYGGRGSRRRRTEFSEVSC